MALDSSGQAEPDPGRSSNTVDVLRRVAATAAVHIYEMEYLEDGRYVCNEFIGEGLESLLGPIPDGADEEQAWEDAVHPDDKAAYLAFNDALRQGRPMELEYRLLGFDRRTRWVWDRARPRFTDGRMLVEGIVTDVTDRHEAGEALADAQRKLAHLAYHDALTDLPNRLKFSEQLERDLAEAARTGSSAAVLFVDMDDFKLVNDSLGHAVGDDLLRVLAGRLRQAVTPKDIVARLGGDEFLVLLPMPGESDPSIVHSVAEETASRIRSIVSRPAELDGVELFVSASVGIALYPFDATAGDELLKHADIEMYRAKQAGREMSRAAVLDSDEATDRLAVAGRLRGAVKRDELVLNYQPIVALDTGAMMGVEALIRWNDPVRGLVQPADFIPVAERTGEIGAISDWVVETACEQERAWRAAGLDLFVSVNLPPILWRPKSMRRVIDTIESFGLDPSRLMIEITEIRCHRRFRGRRADAGRPPATRPGDRHRRLRHRPLVAGPAQSHLGHHHQDRPLVRGRAAVRGQLGSGGRQRHQALPQPRLDAAGRGRRNRGPAALPGRPRLRARPGIPVQPGGAGGRDRDARPAPAADGRVSAQRARGGQCLVRNSLTRCNRWTRRSGRMVAIITCLPLG